MFVIDVLTDKKIDSVLVGTNASSCRLDKNQNLWVLSGGHKDKGIAPQLSLINTADFKIIKKIMFVVGEAPSNLNINKNKDTLYYLNKGVFRLAIQDQNLAAQALIPQNNRNFYGLGINPNNYNIYVSDALDYIQKSNCYIYNSRAEELKMFKAGINAGAFYFE